MRYCFLVIDFRILRFCFSSYNAKNSSNVKSIVNRTTKLYSKEVKIKKFILTEKNDSIELI